jgi:hypothetical protein
MLFIACCFLLLTGIKTSAQYRSAIVYHDEKGQLRYASDSSGNRIPDFSQAGYYRGDSVIPYLPVLVTMRPVDGDNSRRIQKALDSLAALPADAQGRRGTVLLSAGRYELEEEINIRASGIVLRGVGDGEDETSNTILVGKGLDSSAGSCIVRVTGTATSGWKDEIDGTRTKITDGFVPVGARSFRVQHAKKYSPGDNIIIFHPSTQQWIDRVDGGGTDTDPGWMPGEVDIVYKREVVAVNGDQLTVDIPLYDHLDKKLSQCYVYKYNPKGLLRNVGVEHLRIDIQTKNGEDEQHANYGIYFSCVQDCWAKQVTTLHFVRAGIITSTADRVTVDSCRALSPVSKITGERRYNFCVSGYSNNILFSHCTATEARHAFVSNGCGTASGIVFRNSSADINHTASESHRMWSQGMLYDNVVFTDNRKITALALYNRGNYGIGHGWSATHSVAWNCHVIKGRIVIQKPPTGQNYSICSGDTVDGKGPFEHPAGYIEGTGQIPLIPSLYEAQLQERRLHGITPDAPARLRVERQDSHHVLFWNDIAANEEHYVVEASGDGLRFNYVSMLMPNTTSFTITGKRRKYYRVFAMNTAGVSAYSNVAE